MAVTPNQRHLIMALAREAAHSFVDDFAAPLDPHTTEWHVTAWAMDREHVEGLTAADESEAWDLYQTRVCGC